MMKLVYREDRLFQLPDKPTLYTPRQLNYLFQSVGAQDVVPKFSSLTQVPVYSYLIPMDSEGKIWLDSYTFLSEDDDKKGFTTWFRGGWVEPLYYRDCLQPSAIFDAISSCGKLFEFQSHRHERNAWIDVDEFQDMHEDAIDFWSNHFGFTLNGSTSYWVTYVLDDSGYSEILSYEAALIIFVLQPIRVSPNTLLSCFDSINRRMIECKRPNFISANDVKHLCYVDASDAHLCPISVPFLNMIHESAPMWYEHIKVAESQL